jgi:hypothetical protein
MYKTFLTVKELLGLNNVIPPERIPPGEKSFLVRAENIDIDDSRKGTLRGGYGNPVYRGSNLRDMFDFNGTTLFVEGTDLKRLNSDYSADIIHAGAGSGRMNYVGVQNKIFYTNNNIIEYYDIGLGEAVQFPAVDQTFKMPMPPGHLIEWHMGRLYVARDGVLWASDPMSPHQTDSRRGFKQMGGYLTMVRSVQDGLYVSNGDKTFWMPGEFTQMRRDTADEHPAILGSDLRIDGEFVGKGYPRWVIVWMTKTGITVGPAGGEILKATGKFYRPELEFEGAAMIRRLEKTPHQQMFQYVVTQQLPANTEITAVPMASTLHLSASVSIA